MADLIHLCSNNSGLPLTPVGLRKLREAALAGDGVLAEPKAHKLARRLGPDGVAEVVRRYEAGETAAALAAEFAVAKTSLLELLRARGVVIRQQGVTDEQAALLVREYQSSKTIAALERETGISHGTIWRTLQAAGVEMQSRGRRPGVGRV